MSTESTVALSEAQWREREERHHARVEPWVRPRRDRRSAGRTHPVDDFLFDYYPYSLGRLTTWHPGHGVVVLGDVHRFLQHPDYRSVVGGATTDIDRLEPRRQRLALAIRLLESTAAREPQLGCFGMHEWAMVYGLDPSDVRHSSYPLRLGRDEIIDVVRDVGLRCTHIDAYRFFTPAATPLNANVPTRADQHRWEQPGCLHANMDLYKYAMWFQPFVSSDLVADCFDLARSARELDMRAAPYDLADLGCEPIRVETPEGRRHYVREQQAIMQSSTSLRMRLLEVLRALRSALGESSVPDPGRPARRFARNRPGRPASVD